MTNCKCCGQSIPMQKCAYCGKEFEKTRKDRVYCSRNCKTYALLKAKREAKKKETK